MDNTGDLNVTGSGVRVTDSGNIGLNVNAAGAEAGNLALASLVNTDDGDVNLTVAGAITDENGSGVLNVSGGALTLNANGGGIDADVEAQTQVNADSEGTINLRSPGDLPLGLIEGVGEGEEEFYEVNLSSDGAITDTNDGDLNVRGDTVNFTANGGGIDADVEAQTQVNADSEGNINLRNPEGDLRVGLINAVGDEGEELYDVDLAASGAIVDTNGDDTNVIGNFLTLNSENSIGDIEDFLETTVNTLSGHIAGTGDINISNTGSLVIPNESLTTADGDINLVNDGDLTLGLVEANGAVNLAASSIFDSNGDLNNISATRDSLLLVDGVIGLLVNPLDVSIIGATLGVSALNQITGVSVDINGVVSPSNTLLIIGNPPGLVILNGIDLSAIGGGFPSLGASSLSHDLLFSPFFETIVEFFAHRRLRGFPE